MTRATAILCVLATAACDEPERASAPVVVPVAPAVTPARPAIAMSTLPGTLWFVEGPEHTLVCATHAHTASTTALLYPSAEALPDGRVIAIESSGDGRPDGEQLHLAACTREGITSTPIGPRGLAVREPSLDPSATAIAFAANLDGHTNVYRIDLQRPAAHVRLTSDPQGNFHPAWLDAGDVVLASSRDGDSELYRMPARGGAATRLTAFHKDDWHPVPSPDGKQLAFLSDREGRARIFVMSSQGTAIRRLTRASDEVDESAPVWSPDGKRLAYVATRGGRGRVVLHELATGDERELTPPGATDAEPQWSPDGAWLVMVRTQHGRVDLHALATTGDTSLRLTNSEAVERLPRWLPAAK